GWATPGWFCPPPGLALPPPCLRHPVAHSATSSRTPAVNRTWGVMALSSSRRGGCIVTSRRRGLCFGRRLELLHCHGTDAAVAHQHLAALGGHVRLVAQHGVRRPRGHALERRAPQHHVLAVQQRRVGGRVVLQVLLHVFRPAGALIHVGKVIVIGE